MTHRMKGQTMTVTLLALVTAVFLVAGQTSLKHGLVRSGGITGDSMLLMATWVKVLTEPFVLLGFVLYGAASLVWLRVLSEHELSLAYPLISLSYALSLVVGRWFFQDDLNPTRIVGVALIVLGAFVVSRS